MLILYGTQTGNSLHVSNLIKKIIKYGYDDKLLYKINTKPLNSLKITIMEMNSFNIEHILSYKLIIFVCSTHGNGTVPFNMNKFWNFIRSKKLPCDLLKNLKFAVFGLGDSSYEKYNYCSKMLYNALIRLGGASLIRRGCGDSQDPNGFLTDFKPWIQELIRVLNTNNLLNEKDLDLESKISNDIYKATLIKKIYHTSEGFYNSVFELLFKIEDCNNFVVGDCLGVFPKNVNVTEFLTHNKIEASKEFIDDLVCKYDFNSVPHSFFFSALYQYISDNKSYVILRGKSQNNITYDHNKKYISGDIHDKLYEIFSDYDLYYEYIYKNKRTILETLVDLNISVDETFVRKYIPIIYPRYFTLTYFDNKWRITVSSVKYKTGLWKERRGLCSTYFEDLSAGDKILVSIQNSSLFFSKSKLLFFCTGSGITLPRSFLNFAVEQNKEKGNQSIDLEIIIYYGFRYRDEDCLYREEFSELSNHFKSFNIYYVSSREDKRYIQDLYKCQWIKNIEEYDIFISGNSRLNKIFDKIFIELFGKKIKFQSETW